MKRQWAELHSDRLKKLAHERHVKSYKVKSRKDCEKCAKVFEGSEISRGRRFCDACRKILNLEKTSRFKRKNTDKTKASWQRWYLANPDYAKKRSASDPAYRITKNLRIRVYHALKGTVKVGHTLELLGCTVPELQLHLEEQFQEGMTWENYGPVWHCDHIKPCSRFNLVDPVQQRECFHFTNLQPLFAMVNVRKSDKY